ncbi:TIGR02594 family protein [Novosphingobium aquimarinum]|uniref:TIGR02594 family protein n=1 Tax=Novosphingobium aquimarinum TaxID=2682494 RepID=UPI0012EB2F18|nr:TIGR02594 family protein [Novosphingobium aquimarinum]
MTTADTIAAALRAVAPQGVLKQPEVPLIDQLAAMWDARRPPPAGEPAWIAAARSKLGEREIPGPKHNSWIAKGWASLGATWFNDDETPWCGFFVAWCLDQAGLDYPKAFPRAASFKSWGTDCPAQLGAIGVKSRVGGNHVFFIVGQTEDRAYYKALGGNQSNAVTIMDIRKSDVDAIRWPSVEAMPAELKLPMLARGTISRNEA